MQRLEELAENEPERVQIIKKARVTGIKKEGNKVTGVDYEFGGEASSIYGGEFKPSHLTFQSHLIKR